MQKPFSEKQTKRWAALNNSRHPSPWHVCGCPASRQGTVPSLAYCGCLSQPPIRPRPFQTLQASTALLNKAVCAAEQEYLPGFGYQVKALDDGHLCESIARILRLETDHRNACV